MAGSCLSADCRRDAAVCDECVRALALRWWGGIARHGFGVRGARCVLCEIGEPSWCPACALQGEHGAAVRRSGLRAGGVELGEPAPLLGLTDHGTVEVNWRRFEELQAAEQRAFALAARLGEGTAAVHPAAPSPSREGGSGS